MLRFLLLLLLLPMPILAAGLDITADQLDQDAEGRVIASGHVVIHQRSVRQMDKLKIRRLNENEVEASLELITGDAKPEAWLLRLRRHADGWRIASQRQGKPTLSAGFESERPGIRPFILAWAKAWSAQDVDAYLGFYAPAFHGDAASRQVWEQQRNAAIRGKQWIRVDITDLRISHKDAAHALAEFRQHYASEGYADTMLKRLHLEFDGRAWKITAETGIQSFSLPAMETMETPEQALRDWRNAWNRRDLDAYLSRYEADADITGFASRQAWIAHLQKRFAAPPERSLEADRVIVDRARHRIRAEGHVRLHSDEGEIHAAAAELDSETRNGVIEAAAVTLPDGQRLQARRLQRLGPGLFEAEDIRFTTCPADEEAWVLKARKARLDQGEGEISAEHARFAVAGLPLMYAPWWKQPLRRKSGLLTPKLGSGKRRGTEVGLPLYMAPAKTWDATLTPTWMSARGLQGELELRHVDGIGHELVDIAGIRDAVTDSNRSRLKADIDWQLPADLALNIHADHVSDYLYLADYADGTEASSRYLESTASLSQIRVGERFSSNWSLTASHRQSLTTASNAATLQTLPQLESAMQWQAMRHLTLHLDQQTTRFDRRLGVDGWRMDLHPWIELPWELAGGGISATLAGGGHYSRYWLQNGAVPSIQSRISREASLELRSDFERISEARDWRHQISPVVRYDYIQAPDQSSLVNFDSKFGRLAWSNLMSGNRFSGLDRIERVKRISVMLENRLQAKQEHGVREVLLLRLGLAYDMLRQSIDPALQAAPSRPFSDILAELNLAPVSGLRLHASGQYNSAERYWPTLSASLDTSLGPASMHAGYRATDPRYAAEVRLADASASLNIARRWQVHGQWQYDLLLKLTQQTTFGLTYSHPCWKLGLEGYRLNRPNGSGQNADFGGRILLEFKGLGSVGSS